MFQHQHNTSSAAFVNTEHLSVLGFSKYNEASYLQDRRLWGYACNRLDSASIV